MENPLCLPLVSPSALPGISPTRGREQAVVWPFPNPGRRFPPRHSSSPDFLFAEVQGVSPSCLPLVEEMPGRAEGDIQHSPLPYSNSMISSSTARLWPALTATFFTTPRFSALRMFSIFMASTVASA